MSEPNAPLPQEEDQGGEALQFDQAEFTTPVGDRPTCTVCKQPIAEEYYELNGKVLCARCRQAVEAAFRGGSPITRVLRALVLGTVASVAGAAIYYAIIRMTHINFSLVAVLVGFMVGGAVRKGSGHRGGPFYQALAIFLTYSSIVLMYIMPLFLEVLPDEVEQDEKEVGKVELVQRDDAKAKKAPAVVAKEAARLKTDVAQAKVDDAKVKTELAQLKVDTAKPKADAAKQTPEAVAPAPEPARPPAEKVAVNPQPHAPGRPPNLLKFLVALIPIFYQIPVLQSLESPITGLIFAFALWEAWRINRRVVLAFNGPFRLGTAGAGGEVS